MPGTSPPSSSPTRVVVVAGGSPPDPRVAARIRGRPESVVRVIAADRGFDHALALGLAVDVLVGDFDSIKPESLEAARERGTVVHQHPTDKEATDLELALDDALASGSPVTVVIGTGPDDRLDHLAAQFALLASPSYRSIELDAWIGRAHVCVVHGPGSTTIAGRMGELVTLLPVGGPTDGITTTGLRFPLHNESLDPFSTRGVSNEIADPTTAAVAVDRGALLVIRPNALEGHR